MGPLWGTQASRAEANNLPTGTFVEVDGTRLHYIEQGTGDPLVLLHGNGSMIQDFVSSGLVDLASKSYRTIVFDRPGYGHSERPHGTAWTPEVQAELFGRALEKVGVTRAVVLGHSWGASIAVAMALRAPQSVKALVLASGCYYESDSLTASSQAMPLAGGIFRRTLGPITSRAMWPAITRKLFAPAPVPEKFDGFPQEMAFRPTQMDASAEETAMMRNPDAFAAQGRYRELEMPVSIIAGSGDGIIDIEDHSGRLHGEVRQSTFHRVDCGHMVHQSAPERVMAAIDEAAGRQKAGEADVPVNEF